MTRKYRTLILAAVALTLTLAGSAEAGGLHASKPVAKVETGSLVATAWSWLTSLWSASETPLPGDAPQGTTTSCPPEGCSPDSGWGIDPNGGH
jgi:hypothetical protein